MRRFDAGLLPWFLLAAALLAIYVRGLGLDVMEVDAAQYASISMEMLQDGHWLQVKHRGADYLDKPPLLFWLSALSFALFGLSNWAYKLPSFLAALLGVWSVYRFARLYYGSSTARHAAFILASSLGLILVSNDVRTDTLLLGFSAGAVWQLAVYVEKRRLPNLLAGFGCVGLAMLAKGPIGLVMPAFAVGGHLLMKGRYRELFRLEWLAGLLIAALLLAPMCWGLWQQFDLHPEKWVNGRRGVSGLRFFFWEQSFGRITGENVWKNDASAFFFVHVYLWAFLPWSLLLPWALWRIIRTTLAGWKVRPLVSWPEYYSLSGFLLTFLSLSLSHYKLPHYIFITLPWASVLVAGALEQTWARLPRLLLNIGSVASILLGWLPVLWVFPTSLFRVGTVLGAGALAWVFTFRRGTQSPEAETGVASGVWAACLLGFVLNFHFYPRLLPYQCARRAVAAARAEGIPPDALYFFRAHSHAVDFYNGRIVPYIDDSLELLSQVNASGRLAGVFTSPEGYRALKQAGALVERAIALEHFHVAMLNARFLHPPTRRQALQTFYLITLAPAPVSTKK
jgi:4-amino-4-deoxy-L-arabinose transferase-like glycosyltransferase